jgi:general stress protein YciG
MDQVKKKPGPQKGDPRCVAAGRKGGLAVKKKYGPEYFSAVGRIGGKKTLENHGPEHFSEIGLKGGLAFYMPKNLRDV